MPLPGPQTQAYESEADILYYGGAAGGGKDISIDTPMPTVYGWLSMGEIVIGDQVFDEQGKPCNVIAKSKVMHNNTYAVKFSDGSEIIAGEGHQWVTSNLTERTRMLRLTPEQRALRRENRPTRGTGKRLDLADRNRCKSEPALLPTQGVRTTKQLHNTLLCRGRINHSIEVARALELSERELLIDPYVLGAWLGDGTTLAGAMTGIDEEVFQQVANAGYTISLRSTPETRGILGLQTQLKSIGVFGNKHIPSAYLRADKTQRLSLLQGLMDTDGSCDTRGQCEITLTRKKLAEDTHELILSLGAKCVFRESEAKLNGKYVSQRYRLKFLMDMPAFRLSRKVIRQKRDDFRGTHDRRYIVAVDPVPSVPTQCIQVDSPSHCYLAGRSMIPTHNSDMLLGLALTKHHKSIIYRREGTQNVSNIDRLLNEIIGDRRGWNGKDNVWRSGGRQIEFGSCKDLGDERKYQGRPHDLKGFDEITHFQESQFRFLCGWLRAADRTYRKRVVCTGNPPTDQEGQWVKSYWAPWLDPLHPNPAQPGELRWFTTVDGKDMECENGKPFKHNGHMVRALSRTFIPSKVTDNLFMMDSGYEAILQALPEPLRSQMLNGDFSAGTEDSPWQVIPSAWVQAAMDRWSEDGRHGSMDSMGVDVARGGRDQSIISTRYGQWYAKLKRYLGTETPDGPIVAGLAVSEQKDSAPIHVDVIGVGTSVVDHLRSNDIQVEAINGAERAPETARDRSGMLKFRNMRAWLYWSFREDLDPKTGRNVALPPDQALKSALCAATWKLSAQGIQIESKEDIIVRLGRSPDEADAVVYCSVETPKALRTVLAALDASRNEGDYNPMHFGLRR